jgi:hypothetical protein
MRRAHRFSAPRRIEEAERRVYNNNATASINRAMRATVMNNGLMGRANSSVGVLAGSRIASMRAWACLERRSAR